RDGRGRPGETDGTSPSRIRETKAEAEAPQAVGRRAVLIDQTGYVDPADLRRRLRRPCYAHARRQLPCHGANPSEILRKRCGAEDFRVVPEADIVHAGGNVAQGDSAALPLKPGVDEACPEVGVGVWTHTASR